MLKRNLIIWIILGVLSLGAALSSGCSGEKNSQVPAGQPNSPRSAGQPAADSVQQSPAPAPAAQGEPAAAQSQLSPDLENPAQKDAVPVPGDVTPVLQSSLPASSEDDPTKNGPATGASPMEEKTYSLNVGDYFPPCTLAGLNGSTYSSSDLFAGNKVTLVNFWATFCGPCIREMPALEELHHKYAEQGLSVIGIVLDRQKAETARSMAIKLGTTYPHLLDDGQFIPHIYAVPQTFLVDREGKILNAATGARTLEQFVQMIEPHI